MKLNLQAKQAQLQAVQAGITSMWEVTLYPARGNANPPLWVTATGRNSLEATRNALTQNPGYVAGPVRCGGGGTRTWISSPTTRADLRKGLLYSYPFSLIENRMRRCTGFTPSRTSGSARDTITLMA